MNVPAFSYPNQSAFLIALVIDGKLVSPGQWHDFLKKISRLEPGERTDFWIGLKAQLPELEYTYIHDFYVYETLKHKWGVR